MENKIWEAPNKFSCPGLELWKSETDGKGMSLHLFYLHDPLLRAMPILALGKGHSLSLPKRKST